MSDDPATQNAAPLAVVAPSHPPKRSYLLPAVAVGTVVGVAAAVALFGPGPLSLDGMGSPAFMDGVDWGNLVPTSLPTDCG